MYVIASDSEAISNTIGDCFFYNYSMIKNTFTPHSRLSACFTRGDRIIIPEADVQRSKNQLSPMSEAQ
jgi:hypothetical protein